jgi:hypothetical protein
MRLFETINNINNNEMQYASSMNAKLLRTLCHEMAGLCALP